MPSLLTPRAAPLYPQTLTRCYDALSKPDSFGGLPLNQILRSNANLAPLLATIAKSDPEHLRMRTPVRVEQGTADGTVFQVFTDQLVDEYKTNGVKVTYKTYDGVSHGGVVDSGARIRRPGSRVGSGRIAARRSSAPDLLTGRPRRPAVRRQRGSMSSEDAITRVSPSRRPAARARGSWPLGDGGHR